MWIISIVLSINCKFISFDTRQDAHSRQIMSKQDFNDPDLRGLLTEIFVPGQRVGGSTEATRGIVCVGPKELKYWEREPFQLMSVLIKHIVKLCCAHSEGDLFAQFLNDCDTLKNPAQVRVSWLRDSGTEP